MLQPTQGAVIINHTWATKTWAHFYNKFNVSQLRGVIIDPLYLNTNITHQDENDELIFVDPMLGNHEFRTFVGRQYQKVKISRNQAKIAALEKALANVDFDAEIFYDETLPEVALALFFIQKIDRQQITTILEAWQLSKNYMIEHFHRILDDHNNFTPAAKTILLPAINGNLKKIKQMSDDQIEQFRLLVAACHPAEQIFYISDIGRLRQTINSDDEFLANMLISLGSIYIQYKNPDKSLENAALVHISSSVHDALGLARYGDEYVRPISRLGQFTMDDIEEGVFNGMRISALSFPGVKTFGSTLHNWEEVDDKEATAHDKNYHIDVMSITPKPFVAAFKYIVLLARKHLPYHSSREIWDLIDLDYTYFFDNPNLQLDHSNLTAMSHAFCEMIKKRAYLATGSLIRAGQPTVLGLLIFLDMAKHPDRWKNDFKIDPEQLLNPYVLFYSVIKGSYHLMQDDPIEMQLLKCQIRLATDYYQLVLLNKFLDEYQTEIRQRINVKKFTDDLKQTHPKLFEQLKNKDKNTLHFTFEGSLFKMSQVTDLKKRYELHQQFKLFKEKKPATMDAKSYQKQLAINEEHENSLAANDELKKIFW